MPPRKNTATATKKTAVEEKAGSDKRWFKVLVDQTKPPINKEVFSANGGRYCGKNPRQAAGKAFTSLCKAAGEGNHKYIFSVQETTRGSKQRIFTYVGVRSELDKPQVVSRGGTEYSIRFSCDVKAYRESKVTESAPVKKEVPKKTTKKESASKSVKKTPAKKPVKVPSPEVSEEEEEEAAVSDEEVSE